MKNSGIRAAFRSYGAELRNVQWSVSAWLPDGCLVVSLWQHHSRRGEGGSLEFAGSADRWSGPGNNEFRSNVERAFSEGSIVRLVIVFTDEVEWVETGNDASKVKKEFFVRQDLNGHVAAWDGTNYVFQFRKL